MDTSSIQKLSIWRKIGMVFFIPLILIFLLFYTPYSKVKGWWEHKRSKH